MKRFLPLFFFLFPALLISQKQEITLEKIWYGEFRQQTMPSITPMNEDLYSMLNFSRKTLSSSVEVYSFETKKKIKTIIDSKNIPEINYFDTYFLNATESHLLLGTKTEYLYRYSSKSIFYVYEIENKQLTQISTDHIQEPKFSIDGKKIAYVKDNNIFVFDIQTKNKTQITFDGKKNQIINGLTDWVYEEEFAFFRAFEWSLDSKNIAYLKFDESMVPSYSMNLMGVDLYPYTSSFKYPKAGEKNSKVTLHIANLSSATTKEVLLDNYEYIPLLKWTSDNNQLAVATLNRHQNNLKIVSIDCTNLSKKTIYKEKDSCYVDVKNLHSLTFLKNNDFIIESEQNGFNHLYHYSSSGKLKKQITKGNWDVTTFYGIDNKERNLYYQSVEDGSIHRTLYKIGLNGKNKTRISKANGTTDANFSSTMNYAILNYSDANHPLTYSLYHNNKSTIIRNNQSLLNKLKPYQLSKKEFSTITTENGTFNMWMLKPINFDPTKTYPLVMTQYSGPGSQSVSNSWNRHKDYWYHMLTQKGYIVACADVRGTGYKGAAFKKTTYKNLGKYETIDQIDVAKKLGSLPYIDKENIAIFGWSYGGYIASNCILKSDDVFNSAIAVGPVSSWRFYDTVYTERHMRTPQENPDGYDQNSPINYAENLKGHLLIIHGTADDNVHLQNTYQLSNALIQANKPFDQAIYPDRAHGIYRGKNTRLHLFNKMTYFLDQHLTTK